jgi:hypothetical protein
MCNSSKIFLLNAVNVFLLNLMAFFVKTTFLFVYKFTYKSKKILLSDLLTVLYIIFSLKIMILLHFSLKNCSLNYFLIRKMKTFTEQLLGWAHSGNNRENFEQKSLILVSTCNLSQKI